MKNNKLQQFVVKTFSSRGLLPKLVNGYVPQPQQLAYAKAVAETLMTPARKRAAVSLLEAETGTGKTLGYLVPLLGWAAIRGKRVVVSTASNQLQEQMLATDGNVRVAIDCVAAHFGVRLTFAVRYGLRNFISRQRALDVLDYERNASKTGIDPLDKPFIAWLQRSDKLLASQWYDSYDRFPYGITAETICCTEADDEETLEAYRSHADLAREADIVITNHAVTALYGQRRDILDGDYPVSAIVFDEADRFPSIAAQVYNRQAAVSVMRRLGTSIRSSFNMTEESNRLLDEYEHQTTKLEELLKSFDDGADDILILENKEAGSERRRIRSRLSKLADSMSDLSNNIKKRPKEQRSRVGCLLDEFEKYRSSIGEIYRQLADDEEVRYTYPVVSWSETRRYPSLQLISVNPGSVLGAILLGRKSSARHGIITSATLADGRDEGLRHYARDLGIWEENHRVVAQKIFTVDDFGKVDFVLTSGDVTPTLVDDDNVVESNPEWLDTTANMVLDAAGKRHRVVVLTLSMRDTEELHTRLHEKLGSRLIAHLPGTRLSQHVPAYKSSRNGVLLTAGGWEGLDLPGMIDHLIITRLPFSPPYDPTQSVLKEILLRKGMDIDNVEKVIFARALAESRRKFRQGFGRGIRRASDKVTVWICDPRFPHPNDRHGHRRKGLGFLTSIPKRFTEQKGSLPSAYQTARIHGQRVKPTAVSKNPW